MVKDHTVFQVDGKKQRRHLSPHLHMLVALKNFGSTGNACFAHSLKEGLGISVGSVHTHVAQSVEAILSLSHQSLFWPNTNERKVINGQIKESHYFLNCIGMVYGTHLGLQEKPGLHGEDYFTWKSEYAIVAMVVCNGKRRIHSFNVVWPASMHDQQVWKNSYINHNPQLYFSTDEYLVGNMAFSNMYFVVPAYKRSPGENCNDIPAEHAGFNTLLAAL